MVHLLLHKQKLTKKESEQLIAGGVVAIQTDNPDDFKFLTGEVSKLEVNEMVWAALDACSVDDSMYRNVGMRLVENLAKLAAEKVQQSKTSKPTAGTGPIPIETRSK